MMERRTCVTERPVRSTVIINSRLFQKPLIIKGNYVPGVATAWTSDTPGESQREDKLAGGGP